MNSLVPGGERPDVSLNESLLVFLRRAAKVVEDVRSEQALPEIVEQHLFSESPLGFGNGRHLRARMGYLAKLGYDLETYEFPQWLPKSLDENDPFRRALQEFFTSRADTDKRVVLREGKLYKYLLYHRDAPLQPYLASHPFQRDPNIHEELRNLCNGVSVGRVLYSPLISRWHRVYMLMLEFVESGFVEDGPIHHAHDIMVSRLGFS